jgi:hypothetical protein
MVVVPRSTPTILLKEVQNLYFNKEKCDLYTFAPLDSCRRYRMNSLSPCQVHLGSYWSDDVDRGRGTP